MLKNHVFNKANSRIILVSVLWNLMFAVIFISFFHPVYEMNDEFYITALATGLFGEASAYTGFGNIILGGLLKVLHQAAYNVPWLVLYLYGLMFCGSVMITVVLCRAFGMVRGLAITACIWMLFVGTEFFVILNWTRSSALACIAGYAAMIDGVCRRSEKQCIAGGLLVIGGSVLRFDGWLLATPLAGITGIYMLYPLFFVRGKKWFCGLSEKIRQFRKVLMICVAAEVIVLAAYGINNLAYRSERAGEFADFNKLRYLVTEMGTPSYEENREAYEALGITENDFLMLSRWIYADADVFSVESMEKIHELQSKPGLHISELVSGMKETIQLFWGHSFFKFGILMSLLVLVIFGVTWRRTLGVASVTGITLFLIAYLVLGGRYNDRALVGIGFGYWMMLLLIASEDACFSNKERISGILAIPMIIGFCICLRSEYYFSYNTYKDNFQPQEARTAMVDAYTEVYADKNLYLMDIVSEPCFWAYYTPWQVPEKGLMENMYFLGGWIVHSPAEEKILERYSVDNIYEAAVVRDDIFFNMKNISRIRKNVIHIEEHYVDRVDWSVYDNTLNQLIVAVQEPIEGYFPDRETGLKINNIDYSETEEFIWVEGEIDSSENGCYYLRFTDVNEEIYTARVKISEDGKFRVGIGKTELGSDSYTAQLLYKPEGAEVCEWQSEEVYIILVD